MKVISKAGNDEVASVYIADFGNGRRVEFVESVQPPIPRDKKWVLIISTLFGCPVNCRMCDAGGSYHGKLSAEEMLEQIDYLVNQRYPDGSIPAEKFKIQFARMGEPAFNDSVLDVLEQLPQRYNAPGLMPSVSTIAPHGCDSFFERLLAIKQALYSRGRFQLQFSLHSTDSDTRDHLMPIRKWDFQQIAAYGERLFEPDDRKITLNFALAKNVHMHADTLAAHFDPARFIIKITPLNPTYSSVDNGLVSYVDPLDARAEHNELLEQLRQCGYDVILSIGELEENQIGSNCGQYITTYLRAQTDLADAYSYQVNSMT